MDLSGNMRRVLELLASDPKRWWRGIDVPGLPPRAAGMVLRGLKLRGFAQREHGGNGLSTAYRITDEGIAEASLCRMAVH